MRKRYGVIFGVVLLVLVADQLTKLYVDGSMYLYQSIEVLENFFHFTYIRNRGAAFGILANAGDAWRVAFFLATSSAAVVVIVVMIVRYDKEEMLYPTALALILGGAIGNMIDRARLGEVIDFIDVHWYGSHWPAFNIADMAITIGVGLLILQMFTEKEA